MRQLKITPTITNRDSDSIEKYLNEISKIPLISPEEEVKLTVIRKKGRPEVAQKAVESLVKANLRFVVSVAKQYQHQGLTLGELIDEGNLGLIKAAQRFDETKGFKLISFAVWWIRQSILQALAEKSRLVRLPNNRVNLRNRIEKTYAIFEQKFEKEPSPEELAELLNIKTKEVSAILGASSNYISIDGPLIQGEDLNLLDFLENEEIERTDANLDYTESLKTEIDRSLRILNERQKEVICFFFGIGVDHPMSLEDIGVRFNMTRERIRQIKDKAISKLKASQIKHQSGLRAFLG